ncbi:lactococcin 972 family bacteriocin [Streptomyces sp. NPDC057011]|uniref:lactococcin 972 family bacteriocin n=1 Tax=unclassified Streptomyces TaxID=2593676 RepID=UPI003630778C
MKKRGIKLALVAGAVIAASAAPALATTVSVGGGTWDYGAGTATVWSDYYHGSKCHGSSVQGEYYDASGNVSAGSWAFASAPVKLSGNKSYYRTTC